MKFLVKYKIEGEAVVILEDEAAIFNRMDMEDCYDIVIEDIRIADPNENYLQSCIFQGVWSNIKDPLRMEIINAYTDEVVAVGYGTDH